MRAIHKLCLIPAVLVLAGCSSLNPFGSDAPTNKPAELVNFPATATAAKRWTVNVGKSEGFRFRPALVGDSVVAAGADGTIVRADLRSGSQSWRIQAGMPLTAGVGNDGSTIAVAGRKGVILAYNADGKLKWKAQATSEILSAPAVGKGLVIVRSIDNQIAAYDADSGVRRWIIQRPLPALTLRAAPGIAIAGDSAFAALPGGRLSALSLANGAPRWEVPVGDPRGTTELERIADVSGMPLILPQSVCAVAYQGRIGCFDLSSGAPRWAQNFGSDAGISGNESRVVSSNEAAHVVAFDQATGQPAWRNDKLAYRGLSASAVHADWVAVGDASGHVHLLNLSDGSFAARAATDGSAIRVEPLPVPGGIVVQTQAGSLVALNLEKR